MRTRSVAVVLVVVSAAAALAARTGATATWRWTRAEAEFHVRAEGNVSLTASCKGLGKASRRGTAAVYRRFRCSLGFPDGSIFSIVITPTGRTTYHLVSSHRVKHGHDDEHGGKGKSKH
jgi:hypothetical protein